MIETIIGCIVGAAASLVITHIYYKRSGKELESYVKELSKEIENLKEINEKMEQKVNLQIERDYKKDNGEEAKIINESGNYGLQTSSSIRAEVNIAEKK